MGRKLWAELFLRRRQGRRLRRALPRLLASKTSTASLSRLFYDELTLADVVVTVRAAKKETTKDGKKATYYIAEFSYEPADYPR